MKECIYERLDFKAAVPLKNYLIENPGDNILSSYEPGKGISSSGKIISVDSAHYFLTEKMFFNGHQNITCVNCSFGQGLYGGIYNANDELLQVITQSNVTTVQAPNNTDGVYVRFTLANNLGYHFLPFAQYDYITPPDAYNPIGGYLPKRIFYCGQDRPYTTLKSAIEAATSVMDGVLYVDSGIYDLIEEFGSDYFDSLTSTSDLAGLSLRNRIHIVFSPNAVVKCHYTGNNEWVMKMFSPFNAGKYGFTIENLKLEASRCRYAIHDEYASDKDVSKSKYVNCSIKFDNTNNPYWSKTIIGGGLGCATEIDIQGCTFECVGDGAAVYYHQVAGGSVTDYASVINIKNNYIVSGIIELDFTKENASNPTVVQISGNSVPADSRIDENGIYKFGNSFTYNKVYAWNNEIRS